jgi:UDP-N-acetylmuramoyl-tripeptide--D-alanyl-D-alanine ligase
VTTLVAAPVIALTAGFVAEAANGRLVAGDPARVFATVSTDSRALADAGVRAQALFIALKGPNFDGHQFVAELIQNGVAGVLVDRAPQPAGGRGSGDVAVIEVADTLDALQKIARAVRRASRAKVIAITGSAGKTTTKEMTAELLSARFNVFRNAGNLNNHIGLPLSLLELRRGAEVAVVELGMNHADEIRALVAISEPDVRMWINVGDAHIGHFGSRAAIADAKGEILDHAGPETLLIANADDELILARIPQFPGRTITFGLTARADVRAVNVTDLGFDGTRADLSIGGRTVSLRVPLPGRANLMNALAAIAAAAQSGIELDEITSRMQKMRAVSRRGEVTPLFNGARLVDDSYNASPAAMLLALDSLKATPATRRVAVLGEMRELGTLAHDLHFDCGVAAEAAADMLVAIGGADADALAEGAAYAGLAGKNILRFADSVSAADALPALVRDGDLILVKGSRGTRTDIVADRLKGGA